MATRYTDADRAAALAVLQANGGNVARTARETGVPRITLLGWARDVDRQSRTADVIERKRFDLAEVVERELESIFQAMETKRADASYRELATAAGILIDKLRLLTGNATAQGHTHLTIAYDDGPERLVVEWPGDDPKLQAPAEGGG